MKCIGISTRGRWRGLWKLTEATPKRQKNSREIEKCMFDDLDDSSTDWYTGVFMGN